MIFCCYLLYHHTAETAVNVWLSEVEALQMIHLLSGSLLAQNSETLPNFGDGRDER